MVASCKADETCTDTSKGGDFTRYFLIEREEDEPQLAFHPTVTANLKLLGMDPSQGSSESVCKQQWTIYSFSPRFFEPVIALYNVLVVVLLATNMTLYCFTIVHGVMACTI